MSGGEPPALSPPSNCNGGEFLLRLLQQQDNHNHRNSSHSSLTHNLTLDPAVASVGPSGPFPLPHHQFNHHDSHPSLSTPSQNPNVYLPQNTAQPPWPNRLSPSHQTLSFPASSNHHFVQQRQQQKNPSQVMFGNIPFSHSNSTSHVHVNQHVQDNNSNVRSSVCRVKESNFELDFNLSRERELGFDLGSKSRNGFDSNRRIDPRMNWVHTHSTSPEPRFSGPPPPGFLGQSSNKKRGLGDLGNVGRQSSSSSSSSGEFRANYRGLSGSNGKEHDLGWGITNRNNGVGVRRQVDRIGLPGQVEYPGLPGQVDNPGLQAGSAHHSVLGSDVEQSMKVLHGGVDDEVDELSEQLVDSVLDEPSDERSETTAKMKNPRDKDFRSDARGKWILPQRTRNTKCLIDCRRDIHRFSPPFLAIYESLIPAEEEKSKQKQLMALLEKLVCTEWPDAKLYLYGSCANSFGVSKSDIDVCLAFEAQDINKSEILLKLADILQSDNLENVQALTRARVPIVKLMDPVTGISCDICINNVLAVVNTKLLRDYAEIDGRLRQLAFLVKHWAKSRGVNETYQGTLSSYAYVLMCIHFLQQRNPPILPCLQGMKATYAVTVDDIHCAFFDRVERLSNFGAQNNETIAQLLWGFFRYWAYCHDYANTVISIRTGTILSKQEKDWTRRVGNDRHLICIEDPFEVSHDLGRVVDKHSIRVLREEFERAAWIMQYDHNPCVTLFEPYVSG